MVCSPVTHLGTFSYQLYFLDYLKPSTWCVQNLVVSDVTSLEKENQLWKWYEAVLRAVYASTLYNEVCVSLWNRIKFRKYFGEIAVNWITPLLLWMSGKIGKSCSWRKLVYSGGRVSLECESSLDKKFYIQPRNYRLQSIITVYNSLNQF